MENLHDITYRGKMVYENSIPRPGFPVLVAGHYHDRDTMRIFLLQGKEGENLRALRLMRWFVDELMRRCGHASCCWARNCCVAVTRPFYFCKRSQLSYPCNSSYSTRTHLG
jgi:hypothetical protein